MLDRRTVLEAGVGAGVLGARSNRAAPAATQVAPGDGAGQPVPLGDRRELFVDDHLTARLSGKADLRLHSPVPREVALTHDLPWEGNATAYHSVFRDGGRYRMYFRAWSLKVTEGKLGQGLESLSYAESDDGIRWRRPEVGLHEFRGSKANNILLTREAAERDGITISGPAVFLDPNPAAPPEARYKTFFISRSPLGMVPYHSADGLRWTRSHAAPVITDGAFDSQNLVFWDPVRHEYRAYWRYFTRGTTTGSTWKPDGIRAIRTAVSRDLRHWERQADLVYPGSPGEQLYENGVAPYYRAPHLLIGFPVRYVDRAGAVSTSDGGVTPEAVRKRIAEWPASLRALPEFDQRAARSLASERFGSAVTEALFMASRDGVTFRRWNEAFFRPGIERPGTWNYGQQFLAWTPVETRSDLPDAPPELSFYATEGYWTGAGTSLRRYTLRLDGFVSLHAPAAGGELLTRAITFTGRTLSLNFSSSAAGGVRVELQDPDGRRLPGFALRDCDELFGDSVDRTVSWRGRTDLSELRGRPVRLRFAVRDADLYSYRFEG
jgi:hypothetical protein